MDDSLRIGIKIYEDENWIRNLKLYLSIYLN